MRGWVGVAGGAHGAASLARCRSCAVAFAVPTKPRATRHGQAATAPPSTSAGLTHHRGRILSQPCVQEGSGMVCSNCVWLLRPSCQLPRAQ